MSNDIETIDPFESISLAVKPKTPKKVEKGRGVTSADLQKVKEYSLSQGVRSDNKKSRERVRSATFTLYPSDMEVIQNAKSIYFTNSLDDKNISSSDIVRAALHVFSKISEEDMISSIGTHSSRGR